MEYHRIQFRILQNCGPRPSWIKLDAPNISSGNHNDNLFCDIIDNQLYLSGYSCSGTCPDGLQRATITCDCHSEMGPLKFIKQCEWAYKGAPCEFHSDNAYGEFDWECNPFVENCPEDQYELLPENGLSVNLKTANRKQGK